ncbi:RNA polymerase sigma factor [Lacipirellula limnantheis]|uniref:ECF RNA polymerase sigma factor SigW n=1 Tax=Lacipirellula limnantheis TaxID=2528024 RepID=A0A517U227_9BACT|nr:sigma-70 family RNA polymerase sigma factor [Lacipirellula limnantheis]QDT74679.1 ECF RNA polymerase sigma factor SigW [Lacipirellula limnantheis]
MLRCRRRDLAAWDELVAAWNDRLFYFLRQLIDHEHDAANVLQEVWLAAFRNIGGLRHDTHFAPWIYIIARRAAMKYYRGRFARDETTSTEVALHEPGSDVDVQRDFDNAELVHYGLGRLPLAERELLTLHFLDDLSIAEIATVLEIPGGTVKSRLWKARQSLRRILDEEATP